MPLQSKMRLSMKKLITIMLILAIIFTFVACNDKTTLNSVKNNSGSDNKQNNGSSDSPQYDIAAREDWESISGNFVRDDSSQYNNAVLQIKYLSNDCAMFEFRLMEGSESEDSAESLVIPAILIVGEDGIGHYESLPEIEKPFTIDFKLSKDGKNLTITHQGEIDISPDGVYNFVSSDLEVSEVSAISILEHLATAATSLNHNNGDYIIEYPQELVANWFYPVKAVFKDSGAVIAKFLIAKDLSAVYRADDDIEPVLIFGSAQPMLDDTTMPFESDPPEDEDTGELIYDTIPIVDVIIEDGVFFLPAQESKLIVLMPWELPYILKAESSDTSIIEVDENGVVRAISMGDATISGTISIDDGEKAFSIEITVGNPKADFPDVFDYMDDTNDTDSGGNDD